MVSPDDPRPQFHVSAARREDPLPTPSPELPRIFRRGGVRHHYGTVAGGEVTRMQPTDSLEMWQQVRRHAVGQRSAAVLVPLARAYEDDPLRKADVPHPE